MAGRWEDAGEAYLETTEHGAALVELVDGADVSRERAAEEQLAHLEALADIGLWAWNVVDEEVEWSDHYRTVHCLPRDATPSVAGALEAIHPDDRARVSRIIDEVVGRGRTWPVRYRVVGPGGEVRHVEGRADVVRDTAGNIIIESTTRRVQDIVSGLLEATTLAAGEVGPGALVRQRPAGGGTPPGSGRAGPATAGAPTAPTVVQAPPGRAGRP